MYCPSIPRQNSCIPLRKNITQIMEVQPNAELWNISWRIESTTIATAEHAQNANPITAATASGIVENDVSASSE